MNLSVHIAFRGGELGTDRVCGITISNTATGEAVRELSYIVARGDSAAAAQYNGLLRAIDAVTPLRPEEVEFHSPSQQLVNQIIGAEAIGDAALGSLHQRAMMGLLKLDSWHITHEKRAAEQTAEMPIARQPRVVHRWTARFTASGGPACPLPPAEGKLYAFGPGTPSGLCVHAAEVILSEGPLYWPTDQAEGEITCPTCGASIQVSVTH